MTERSSSGVLRSQVLSSLVHSLRVQADSSKRPRGGREGRQPSLPGTRHPPCSAARDVWGQLLPQARRRRRWEGLCAGRGGQAQPWSRVAGPGRGVEVRGLPLPGPRLSWPEPGRSLSHWPHPALGSFLGARVGRPLNHRDITSILALIGRPQLQVCTRFIL